MYAHILWTVLETCGFSSNLHDERQSLRVDGIDPVQIVEQLGLRHRKEE
jgi:hypothetical protein